MEGQPHKLLESVADRLVNEILNDYHMVQGLQLRVKKPHVAVPGVVESLGKHLLSVLLGFCLMPKSQNTESLESLAGIEITRYRAQMT